MMVIDRHHRAARIAWPGSAAGGGSARSAVLSVCIWMAAVVAGLAVTVAAEPDGPAVLRVARDAGSLLADVDSGIR